MVVNRIYLVVVLCALLGAVAQVLLKKGSVGSLLAFNPYLFGGLFLYAVAMIGYLWALRQGELSMTYPLIAFTYIFVCFLSWLFLKESLTLAKVVGSVWIVLGVWVIMNG